MSFQVEGKVAVVTGGSSGIGLAAIEILVAEGAKVAWCGRDEERLNASKHYILEKFPHANIFTKACNVLKKEEVQQFAKEVKLNLGNVPQSSQAHLAKAPIQYRFSGYPAFAADRQTADSADRFPAS